MNSTSISFAKEKNGYNRAQVDSYVMKIGEAYQKTYDEYLDISDKYKTLLEESQNTESNEQASANHDIAAKVLLNSEMLAQKIITDAQAEAAAVIAEARIIISEANDEAIKATEYAKRVRSDADIEAAARVAHTRKNLQLAQKTMEQASIEIEELLAFRAPESENNVYGLSKLDEVFAFHMKERRKFSA